MNTSRVRDFYERQGAEALRAGSGFCCSEKPIVDVVIEMARQRLGEFHTVLDVGCGANLHYDLAIAAEGKAVHAVDFTLNFLRLTPSEHPGVFLAQADALRLPYRSASFDAVICSETVEHIPDHRAVIAEIARVLKANGLLFITVPNLWNAGRVSQMIKERQFKIELMEGHVREYSPRQLKRLLSTWFTVERHVPVGFGWSGRFGGRIESGIRCGLLRRLSKSIAFVARRHRHAATRPSSR
jgi:SAM-dependent methyltransferase